MASAREAGKTLSSHMLSSGLESVLWDRYSLEGPSNIRTQILLAQIIQAISGFGGKSVSIETILPYWSELTGIEDPKEKRQRERKERHQQASVMFLDNIKSKGST